MKRPIAAFLIIGAAVLLCFTIAHPAQSQTGNAQVTLSCNDGHA